MFKITDTLNKDIECDLLYIGDSKNYNEMKYEFDQSLVMKEFGIKLPKHTTKTGRTLLLLYKYKNTIVKKEHIQNVMAIFDTSSVDIQAQRHLSLQYGFNILKGKNMFEGRELASREYVFLGFDDVYEDFKEDKRMENINVNSFEELKAKYDYKCGVCGVAEGERHRYYISTITSLERGHMNPNISLCLDNCIPLCQICNKIYKDEFIFNPKGQLKVNEEKHV